MNSYMVGNTSAAYLIQPSKPVSFTGIGFLFLGIVGLMLAANDKTGPYVIWVLLLMLLLILLINYQQLTKVLFK